MADNFDGNEIDYFLLMAEEMNLTRAAERAFVTQQCLSKSLRRLESRYGVELFYRKPHLKLTPAGEMFLRRAKQFHQLFNATEQEMYRFTHGDTGALHIGIVPSRCVLLLNYVLPRFRQLYPNVELFFENGTADVFYKRVVEGSLDMCLSIALDTPPELTLIPLCCDTMCTVITDAMLKCYFPDEYPECKLRFSNGIDLHEFKDVPFMASTEKSRFTRALAKYLRDHNVKLSFMATMDFIETHLAVVDSLACFLLSWQSFYVTQLNEHRPADDQINMFPLADFQDILSIELALYKGRELSQYAREFIRLVQEYYSSYNKNKFLIAGGAI